MNRRLARNIAKAILENKEDVIEAFTYDHELRDHDRSQSIESGIHIDENRLAKLIEGILEENS